MKQERKDIQVVLKELQELYSKYKFMESRLVQQKKNLLSKIPDIKSAHQAVEYLITKQVCFLSVCMRSLSCCPTRRNGFAGIPMLHLCLWSGDLRCQSCLNCVQSVEGLPS